MHRYTRSSIQFSLLLAFLTLPGLHLAAQPQIVYPLKVDEILHDIAFRNSVEGYALGSQTLWHTVNGGITWTSTLPLVFRPPFTAIALFGETGLIIGDEMGGIHVAIHPDSTWISGDPGNGKAIKEIEVIDRNSWVAITDSVILSTLDGGRTYRQFVLNNMTELASLDVTNASTMHVSEDAFSIWRTTDGGATWNLLPSGENRFGILYDVQFTSADTGFVASWYPWNLFTTTDGGATWSQGPFEYPTSIAISRDGVGAYTTTDYMRLSHDGGMTWPDSVLFSEEFPFENFERQKVVTASSNTIFFLLSNTEMNRSVVARVDGLSAVREHQQLLPHLQLDLSLRD